jgi:hypothetical protein
MFNARYSDVYQRPEEKFAFPWFTKVDGFSPAPPTNPTNITNNKERPDSVKT